MTELERRQVWEGWLAAEIRASYFADLSSQYRRVQHAVSWVSLFASSGAVATLSASAQLVGSVLLVLTAALSLYAVVVRPDERAITSADLYGRWTELANDFRRLWDDQAAPDAPVRLRALEARDIELSKAGQQLPAREKQLRKWQAHVQRHRLAGVATAS